MRSEHECDQAKEVIKILVDAGVIPHQEICFETYMINWDAAFAILDLLNPPTSKEGDGE